MIMKIVEHENSQMIKEEEDRDKKILFALLSTDNFSLKKQMWFTLRCNRADIAKELLSNASHFNTLENEDKNELMTKILHLRRSPTFMQLMKMRICLNLKTRRSL